MNSYDSSKDAKGKSKGKLSDSGKGEYKGARKDSGEKGKAKGKKGKDRKGEEKESEYYTIDLEEYNILPESPFRDLFLGENGQNIKHIRSQTGAQVWLYGKGSGYTVAETGMESDEPLHVIVSASDEDSLDMAVDQANDLIESVIEKYYHWLDTGSIGDGSEGDRHGSKGRSKSRGKYVGHVNR